MSRCRPSVCRTSPELVRIYRCNRSAFVRPWTHKMQSTKLVVSQARQVVQTMTGSDDHRCHFGAVAPGARAHLHFVAFLVNKAKPHIAHLELLNLENILTCCEAFLPHIDVFFDASKNTVVSIPFVDPPCCLQRQRHSAIWSFCPVHKRHRGCAPARRDSYLRSFPSPPQKYCQSSQGARHVNL